MSRKMLDLEAFVRQETGKNKLPAVRNAGFVPGILYGKGRPSIPLKINLKELKKAFSTEAGLNVILNLKISGGKGTEEHPAKAQEVTHHIISDEVLHVDFHAIELKEKLQTSVPVHIVGTSPGIKDGGIVVSILREVKVECLPLDIPSHIDLDITILALNKSLHVSDIQVDAGKIKILNPAEDVVVSCMVPKEEVVEETAAAVTEAAQPEVITKGKKEEEGVEGAAEAGAEAKTDKPAAAASPEKKAEPKK
jgi:large subunit ribosomal protein L25